MRGILALLALTFAGCNEPAERPPNLLLVTIDTLRADRLACYGGDAAVGGRLCELADEGTRFTWALSPAPATAPAVASLLTGRYPSGHGVSQLAESSLHEDHLTVAEALSAAGYDTGAVVSNPVLRVGRRLEQGFGHYDDRMTRSERNRPGLRERAAEETTRAAVSFLAAATEPWFLWVHYQDPHGPYEPPGAASPTDPPGESPLPVLRHQSGYGGIPAYQELPGARTAPAYEQAYGDEIQYLERHLGTLLDFVDRAHRPFVVVTSDHGEAFGEDGYWFAHGHSVGLDQIRVPLLVRPAGGGPAEVAVRPASTASVAATLIRAAGLPIPDAFQTPPLPLGGERTGETPDAARAPLVVAEHPERLAVVAGDRYYARDRDGLSAGQRDPISGGVVWPLPARAARLGPDAAEVAYVDGQPPSLETALRGHLEAVAATGEAGETDATPPVSEPQRRALEALGYLE